MVRNITLVEFFKLCKEKKYSSMEIWISRFEESKVTPPNYELLYKKPYKGGFISFDGNKIYSDNDNLYNEICRLENEYSNYLKKPSSNSIEYDTRYSESYQSNYFRNLHTNIKNSLTEFRELLEAMIED
jgi:hypothetical protein